MKVVEKKVNYVGPEESGSILKNIYRRRVNRRTGVRHYGKK
jgi:hypothetical protein